VKQIAVVSSDGGRRWTLAAVIENGTRQWPESHERPAPDRQRAGESSLSQG
jgi:hypothetical protein